MRCVDGKISVWNCHRIFCSCHRERTGSDTLNICALWARSCFIVSDFLGSDRIFQIFRLQQLILLALLAYNFLLKLCSWRFRMHWLLQYFIKINVCSFHSGNNLLMAWCAQLLNFFLFFALFCVEKIIIFDASFYLVRFRGQMRLRLLELFLFVVHTLFFYLRYYFRALWTFPWHHFFLRFLQRCGLTIKVSLNRALAFELRIVCYRWRH